MDNDSTDGAVLVNGNDADQDQDQDKEWASEWVSPFFFDKELVDVLSIDIFFFEAIFIVICRHILYFIGVGIEKQPTVI